MEMPRLTMQSQFAKIHIQSTNATLQIEQPDAEMRIEQPQAKLQMKRTEGKLTIDQTAAREAMDIKSVFLRVRENAQYGQQKLMEGIARVAREGDEMLQIQSGRNVLVEQAKRHANPPPKETTIAYIPPPFSVKYHYTPGTQMIDFTEQKPRIDVRTEKPMIHYSPSSIHISLAQSAQLQIDVVK